MRFIPSYLFAGGAKSHASPLSCNRDDLGFLPGDDLLEKKRKSLKRLKKAQRTKQEAPDAAADANGEPVPDSYQPPDGRHISQRNWPRLPLDKLATVVGSFGELAAQGEGGPDAEPDAEVVTMESVLAKEGQEGPLESILTTAHRQVIRARDETWDTFIADLDASLNGINERYQSLLDEEMRWEKNWSELVAKLKADNVSDEAPASDQHAA